MFIKRMRPVEEHDQWRMWVLGFAYIIDGLVQVLSFGLLYTELKEYLMFDRWDKDWHD